MTPTLPFLPRYIRSGAVASLVPVTCIKTTWVTRITAAISMWPITRVCSIHPSYLKMYRHNTPINNPPNSKKILRHTHKVCHRHHIYGSVVACIPFFFKWFSVLFVLQSGKRAALVHVPSEKFAHWVETIWPDVKVMRALCRPPLNPRSA